MQTYSAELIAAPKDEWPETREWKRQCRFYRARNIWEYEYINTRRKHNHRCRICARVLKNGDKATLWRPWNKRGTHAAHTSCLDTVVDAKSQQPTWTYRDSVNVWVCPPEPTRRCTL